MWTGQENTEPDPIANAHVSADTRLSGFCQRVFADLQRADQRQWARAYVTALLATPGKKSIHRLALTACSSPYAAHSLRQFVNVSTWSWQSVSQRLAAWAEEQGTVNAWQLGQVLVPKRGKSSVGVHRRYDPSSDRTVNCQVGYGAFLRIGSATVPVAWELSLPGPWSDNAQLRERAGIPAEERYRSKGDHARRLLDRLAAGNTPAPLVFDDSDDREAAMLLRRLGHEGQPFVVAVPRTLPVVEADFTSRGTLPAADLLTRPGSACTTVQTGTPNGGRERIRVLSAAIHIPGTRVGQYQLFTRLDDQRRRGRLWVTDLSRDSLPEAVRLSLLAGGPEEAVQTMAQRFGLLDFEGRSFRGWHHHMTLVSVAYTYQRLSTLASSQAVAEFSEKPSRVRGAAGDGSGVRSVARANSGVGRRP